MNRVCVTYVPGEAAAAGPALGRRRGRLHLDEQVLPVTEEVGQSHGLPGRTVRAARVHPANTK